MTAESSGTEKARTRRRKRSGATESQGAYDPSLIKALGHPVRQQALVGKVAYHVKTLEELGAIELVKTAPSGPSIEHFYRATMRPYIDEEHWSKLPPSMRNALFDQTLQHIWDHTVEAAADDGFADPSTHVTWTTLELDEEAYDELANELLEVLEHAMERHAEAAARLGTGSDEERQSRRTELVIMHFDRSSKARSNARGRRSRRKAG
jgi:hypothetical protein